jgi:acyl-CoA synthetase (AMP-forming)/AMP-acid ligase II
VDGLRDLTGTPPGQDPDTVSTLIPTSGTTGTPKIAMRSANCSLAMARTVVSRSQVSGDDVLLVAAPLYGGVGFINGVCAPALTGCTLVLPADLQAATLLGLIKQYRVTRVATLPTLATRMMTFPGFVPGDAQTVGVIQTGGQQLPPSTAKELEAAFGCRVGITYGAIDVGVPAMVDSFGDSADKRYTTVGRVAPGAELAILDPMGETLPPGEAGEVAMRGPDTAIGYFDDPRGTDAVFGVNGWGRLGDQGTIDDDGYLRLTGRIKEIVNRGGKKFSLAEVETVVAQLDVVQDVAAVTYPDADLGERCAVFLVSRDGRPVTLPGLTAVLASRGVPKHLWPERVECVAALPVSGSGKVARAELRHRLISPR